VYDDGELNVDFRAVAYGTPGYYERRAAEVETKTAYARGAYPSSEVKSSRGGGASSPGGMSSDSAYAADDDARRRWERDDGMKKGTLKRSVDASDGKGRGWVLFALGAIAASAAMRVAASPQAVAVRAMVLLTARRARDDARRSVANVKSKAIEAVRQKLAQRKLKTTPQTVSYEVKHWRRTSESAVDLPPREPPTIQDFANAPARDVRWKPNAMTGRG
jgi:hypothetical protein